MWQKTSFSKLPWNLYYLIYLTKSMCWSINQENTKICFSPDFSFWSNFPSTWRSPMIIPHSNTAVAASDCGSVFLQQEQGSSSVDGKTNGANFRLNPARTPIVFTVTSSVSVTHHKRKVKGFCVRILSSSSTQRSDNHDMKQMFQDILSAWMFHCGWRGMWA